MRAFGFGVAQLEQLDVRNGRNADDGVCLVDSGSFCCKGAHEKQDTCAHCPWSSRGYNEFSRTGSWLIGWVTAHPEVSLQLLGRLAQRLRKANDVLSDLVFADVPGRVAKAIIELGERFGTKKDDGLHVNHELTQEELAQLVGASRETVNKALADFASRGWVKLEPRAVIILDYERLVKRGR